MSTAYARLPLNALRVFEAVGSRLSFADAAEALHVTPAAVSQQLRFREAPRPPLRHPAGADSASAGQPPAATG